MAQTKQAKATLPLARRHKEDITNLLILRFQKLMREGVLTPGALLPSERELAATFGVARSSLRQAMKVLETMGVVTQKVGDGTYLSTDGTYVLSVPMDFLFLLDDISLEDLMELRLMLEPALAAKAAERATVDHIQVLKQSMRDMQEKGIRPEEIAAADLLFHRTIFRATGNALGSRLFHSIHSALFKMIASTAQVVQVEHTVRFHRPILEAIEQRNPKRAALRMTEHLEDARDLILRQQKEQESLRLRRHLAEGHERPVTIARDPVVTSRKSRALAVAASSAD
jgi:GntR family transcriptional repressor for pyruvate dehydrogenase complex